MIPQGSTKPRAVLRRPDVPDCFYAGYEPSAILKGGPGEWALLDDYLSQYSRSERDCMHPPGALIGSIDYDGSFEFLAYPELEQIHPDSLFLGEIHQQVPQDGIHWDSSHDLDAYAWMVETAREYIRSGDIYQVNLTRRFTTEVPDFDGFSFFKALWQKTRAPYASYLHLEGRELMSSSPELFLSIQGQRILTQPIKGTRPRGRTPTEDRQNALELATHPKEVAELVMITDLERNDLGTVCEYGSVQVKELVRCREYSHVFHLVSTVEGRLRQGLTPVQAVAACFPGGSITGAPKRRAIEIIRELEGMDRGFYTGAIGYFGFDGSVQLGMAIRTCEHRDNTLSFWTGSGITIDSDARKEFEETNHKAAAMKEALALYEDARRQDLGAAQPS